ncbi:MAG: type 4a pilus biogenesis protein PilO [Actinomycetota bacterium]|nr:type 4a pilus biogenesis protein PilO [Actinomycetota bacterium]
MKNLTLRQRIFGSTIAIGVLILIAFYFLLWKPTSNKIAIEGGALTQAQQQLTTLDGQISSLKSFQEQLPAAQAEANRLSSAVPTTPDLPSFILALNTISQKSGITFLSISPSQAIAVSSTSSSGSTTNTVATATGSNLYQVQVSLQVDGGYFQVLDFINRLDHLPRLVVVNAVNLTASNGSSSSQSSTLATVAANSGTQLSASLKLTIFSQAAPVGEPGAPSTNPAGAAVKLAPPSSPVSTTAAG